LRACLAYLLTRRCSAMIVSVSSRFISHDREVLVYLQEASRKRMKVHMLVDKCIEIYHDLNLGENRSSAGTAFFCSNAGKTESPIDQPVLRASIKPSDETQVPLPMTTVLFWQKKCCDALRNKSQIIYNSNGCRPFRYSIFLRLYFAARNHRRNCPLDLSFRQLPRHGQCH
jgi:hypothetical protein